ncbi:uncharacterized protein LOC143361050 isoform X1 [Halictus rubicundus]|uniref:uncharacterized protein LOC143361050 isoform X1 n=1 Tax=Halictus rubicundus TaxID=77578 RepID=UPI004037231D
MDVFKQNYSTYYNVLNFTGLWPYNHSLTAKLQRVVYSVVTLCCIVIQISTLRMADMSVYNCVMVMSYGFPMLLFFLRYVGFVVNFPVIKCMFENIEKDFVALQNPIEAGMLMKQIAETRRVIVALVGLMCLGVLILFSALLVPTILKSQRQIYYLNVFGFLYVERNHETDLVCFQILYISTIGLLSVACTEASLAVFSSYLCGLFEIASYRIQTAVNTMAKSEKSGILIDIRSAVDIHRRAVELSSSLTSNMMLSYLVAIVAVVASFAVNLYRLLLAMNEMSQPENLVITVMIVLVHVIIMLLNNYSGQKLMTISIEVFHQTYNSLWYCIPPKSQKMLLFVLMKSAVEVQFNLAGLFVPCYQGFTTMMSSSFSYFTVLLSV